EIELIGAERLERLPALLLEPVVGPEVTVTPHDDDPPPLRVRAHDEEEALLTIGVVAPDPEPDEVVEGLNEVDGGVLNHAVAADLDGVVPRLAEPLEVQERALGLEIEHV